MALWRPPEVGLRTTLGCVVTDWIVVVVCVQGQPPPEGGDGEQEREQAEDKKQKENTAYAKKMVLRLAGLMGLGGAVSIVYLFGEWGRF